MATGWSSASSATARPSRACCCGSSMQADLRLVAPESRGAAMQYFTGSKAHNIALRQRALSPRAHAERIRPVPTSPAARRSPARPRKASTRRWGWPWIDPALRENRGEIAAAEAGMLPTPDHAERPARRPAHAHDRDRRPDDIESMARGRAATAGSIHRHHRPLQSLAMANGLDERAGARPRGARSARSTRGRRHHAAGGHRVRHHRRRPARPGGRRPRAARFRRRARCTRRSTRRRGR